jgi:hypothetical protein
VCTPSQQRQATALSLFRSTAQVFSQWITVLPTDQIVASEYKPTDFTV